MGSTTAAEPLVRQALRRWHETCTVATDTVPRPSFTTRSVCSRETIRIMSSTSERRRHPRFAVAWPVRLWVDDEPLLGRAEDASRNGLWVTVAPTMALTLGKICWIDVMSDEL